VLQALLPAQLLVRRWNLPFAGESTKARRQYMTYRRRTAWCAGSGQLSPAVRSDGLSVRRQWDF
jgi:hypothetical protein